jgi:Protein of unknown function (DUF3303)
LIVSASFWRSSAIVTLADATGPPIHQWVQRCDGNGGFAVVETDDQADLFRDLAVWAPWLDFEVVPVLDIADATPITQEALEKVRSVV